MGSPIHPTPADRLATRSLAAAVLEAIREDEAMPLPIGAANAGRVNQWLVYDKRDAESLIAQLCGEIVELTSERARLSAAISAVIDTFDGAVANFESRGKGGQQVSYHGDFANMPPSSASAMRRWSRDLRCALRGEWPMTREEEQP